MSQDKNPRKTSHCYGKSPRVIPKPSKMSIFRSYVELRECTFRLFLPRNRRSPSRLRFRFSSLAERNNFTKCVKVWRNLSSSWVFDRGLLQPIHRNTSSWKFSSFSLLWVAWEWFLATTCIWGSPRCFWMCHSRKEID